MKNFLITSWNALKYLLIYFVLQVMGMFVVGMYYGMRHGKNTPQDELAGMVMQNVFQVTTIAAAISLLVYWLMLRRKEETLWKKRSLGKIYPYQTLLGIATSIGLAAFTCSLAGIIQYMFPNYTEVAKNIESTRGSMIGIICMIVLLPTFEEILFRGLIFNEFRKNTNIKIAVIVQAFIFAVSHGNLLQGIYTFIIGLVICCIYMWTNSLWSAIIVHISYNFLGVFVFPYLLNTGVLDVNTGIAGGIAIMAISLAALFRSVKEEEIQEVSLSE
ncbi:MAG: CPBP family intramembrane glutamic endopeptidase [Bacillota bacterium]